MLISVEERVETMEVEDWISTKRITVGYYDDLKTILKVTFSDKALKLPSRPWRKALVAKFLGKSMGY